jgi:hypothetical protein
MGSMMLADLMITGHRLNIKNDIYYTTGVAIGFTVFTYIYYICGGTDCKGGRLIYPVLNWEKPGETWLFCAGKAIFVAIIHLFSFSLCKLRIMLFKNIYLKNECINHVKADELQNVIENNK